MAMFRSRRTALCSHFITNIDIYLVILSAALGFTAAIDFTVLQVKVGSNCFLFGQIFEMKRIFISGPISACWFYMLTLYAVGLFALSCTITALMYTPGHICKNWLYDFTARFVVTTTIIIDYVLISRGLQSLCDSLEVNKICESDVFRYTDFETYTPKYLDGNGVYDFCQRGKIYCTILLCLWISSVVLRCKRHH